MTEHKKTEPAPERVADRAELLPEERAAGNADPERQARAILEDAAERTAAAVESPRTAGERRTSDEATTPLS